MHNIQGSCSDCDIVIYVFLFVPGNNNASPKEGVHWRGGVRGESGCGPVGGGECGGCGGCGGGPGDLEGSAGGGPDQLEGPGPVADDAVHLKRRVGLVSGVALIVGTMIGQSDSTLNTTHAMFAVQCLWY